MESGNRHRNPKLSPTRLDELIAPRSKIWGLDAIAGYLGIGKDKARKLAKSGRAPIYQPDGQGCYVAFRSDLAAWLRGEWRKEE